MSENKLSESEVLPRFVAPSDGAADGSFALSDAMLDAYRRDGCLVIENFFDGASAAALIERAERLVDEFETTSEQLTAFCGDDQTHKDDRYFRESGDKIRFFFEPEAFGERGQLRRSMARSVNKIGHALHDLDPGFNAFSRRPALAAVVASLGVQQPLLLQSMLIFKQPHIGDAVSCHQDTTFLYTEPNSCTGFWFALEDADRDNGCLWVIPGRHPLRQRFRYRGGELLMETIDERPWATAAQPLEVARGTLVVLHGLLPHYSGLNRSGRSRCAYTLHVIDGASHYPADNWLRRAPDRPPRGFA